VVGVIWENKLYQLLSKTEAFGIFLPSYKVKKFAAKAALLPGLSFPCRVFKNSFSHSPRSAVLQGLGTS
jgi:hypothetical protein